MKMRAPHKTILQIILFECVVRKIVRKAYSGIKQSHLRNSRKWLCYAVCDGADNQIRTGDLILTKDALYQLSYISNSTLKFKNNDIIAH